MKWLKLAASAVFIILLAVYPAQAEEAARAGMALWAGVIAPTLFPFMAVLPALTSPDACTLYKRWFGRFMGPVFGCPGEAASALIIGMLSGGPAGTAAARSLAEQGALTPPQIRRLLPIISFISPTFILGSVAQGMLGGLASGVLLLISHGGALLLCGVFTRGMFEDNMGSGSKLTQRITPKAMPAGRAARPAATSPGIPVSHPPSAALPQSPSIAAVPQAVKLTLTIGGYIVLFQVIGAFATQLLSLLPKVGEVAGLAATAVLEMSGGCVALARAGLSGVGAVSAASGAALALSPRWTLPLISATLSFGGVSIIAQNLSIARNMGVDKAQYVAVKLLHALLSAALCMLGQQLWPGLGGVFSDQAPIVTKAMYDFSGPMGGMYPYIYPTLYPPMYPVYPVSLKAAGMMALLWLAPWVIVLAMWGILHFVELRRERLGKVTEKAARTTKG